MSSELNEKKLGIFAKNFVKSEMGKKLIKPAELAKSLDVDQFILSNKIGRGKFSAGFFLQVLQALGTKDIPVPPESKDEYDLFKDL